MAHPVILGLRTGVVWALARTQWTLSLRFPTASPTERVITWGLLGPILAIAGCGCGWVGFRAICQLAEEPQYLQYFLTGFGGFVLLSYFLVLPLTQSKSGFDSSKIFHLPLSPGEILTSLVFGNALNPTFVLLPGAFFIGCVVGALGSGRALLALACFAGGALWLFQFALLIAVGDLASLSFKRSRWFNRALLVLLLVSLLPAGALLRASGGTEPGSAWMVVIDLLRGSAPVLVYLPGLSPLAWVARLPGWWALAGVALLETAALHWIGAHLLGRLMSGSAIERRVATAPRAIAAGERGGFVERTVLWACVAKDLRILWRERNFKILLLGLTVILVVFPGIATASDVPWESLRGLLQGAAPLVVIWFLGTLSFNNLGYEASGVLFLFGSPASRWRFLAGKNLAFLALSLAMVTLSEGILLAQGATWPSILADYLFTACLGLLYFGGGNYTSILWPLPTSLPGKSVGGKVSPIRVFVASFNQFLCMVLIMGLAVPLFAGRYALSEMNASGAPFWCIGIVMVLYTLGTYGLMLLGSDRLMRNREPEIIERLVRS